MYLLEQQHQLMNREIFLNKTNEHHVALFLAGSKSAKAVEEKDSVYV